MISETNSTTYSDIPFEAVVHNTREAAKVRLDPDTTVWIPFSVMEDGEIDPDEDSVAIADWWLIKEGLDNFA